MRKILLLLAIFIFPYLLQAQLYNNAIVNAYIPAEENAFNHKIQIGAGFDIASNAVNNMLFNKYLYTSFLDEQAKESVLTHLKSDNRLGAYGNQYAFYSWKKENSSNAFYIQFRNRKQYGVNFTDDAYKALLFGNSRLAGKKAVFDDSRYYRITYQALQGGISRKMNEKLTIGGGIGLVRGSRYTDINVKHAFLFTSLSGDSLSLQADATARYANLRGNENETAGWGALANFFAIYALGEKSFVSFSLDDAGFVYFNQSKPRTYSGNRQITYWGFEINDFNSNFTPENFVLLPEKLYNEIDSAEVNQSFSSYLPAQFQVIYKQHLAGKTSAVFGLEYFAGAAHLPAVHMNINQEIIKGFWMQAGVNLFGYGKYGVNLSTKLNIAKSWVLIAGTEHAEMPFSYRNTFGQGGYFGVSKGF